MLVASVSISSKSCVLSVAWLTKFPRVALLGGGGLVRGLLHPLRRVVTSGLAYSVRHFV